MRVTAKLQELKRQWALARYHKDYYGADKLKGEINRLKRQKRR